MLSKNLEVTINKAIDSAKKYKHLEVTTEHLLLALTQDPDTKRALIACSVDVDVLSKQMSSYLDNISFKSSFFSSLSDLTSYYLLFYSWFYYYC